MSLKEQIEQTPDMSVCNRCDGEAEHKVAIAANYEDAHVNWRPLCDDCLKKLGEWWRGEEA